MSTCNALTWKQHTKALRADQKKRRLPCFLALTLGASPLPVAPKIFDWELSAGLFAFAFGVFGASGSPNMLLDSNRFLCCWAASFGSASAALPKMLLEAPPGGAKTLQTQSIHLRMGIVNFY